MIFAIFESKASTGSFRYVEGHEPLHVIVVQSKIEYVEILSNSGGIGRFWNCHYPALYGEADQNLRWSFGMLRRQGDYLVIREKIGNLALPRFSGAAERRISGKNDA